MTNRFQNARAAQSGACNPRPISAALNAAIAECNVEDVSSEYDPAVFLILHQLVFILTGHDFTHSERMSKRWDEATKAVDIKLDNFAAASATHDRESGFCG